MAEKAAFDVTGVRSVVLVPRQDFGRSALGTDLPAALWPIAGQPVLKRLLGHLADDGVRDVAVCCAEDVSASVAALQFDQRLTVRLVTEELTNGTAGCLREAVASDPGDLIVVLSGAITCPPSIQELVEAHAAGQADLTMVFNPGPRNRPSQWTPAEIYVCQPQVLKLIPPEGYCDIKEGLIPVVQRAGGTIQPFVPSRGTGNFHDQAGYLDAVSLYLKSDVAKDEGYTLCERSDRRLTAAVCGGRVDPGARLYGPLAIAEDAYVAKDAVVIGPSVLDRGTRVDENSVVVSSVLWEGSAVGADCEVRGSIIGHSAVIPAGSIVMEQAIAARETRSYRRAPKRTVTVKGRADRLSGSSMKSNAGPAAQTLTAWSQISPRGRACIIGGAAILFAFLWSYWATLANLWQVWRRSDEYSAGLLVPFLAGYVLWTRRRDLALVPVRPAVFSGIVVFALAQALRGLGMFFMYNSAERLSIILSVTAVTILLLGWTFTRKLAPVLAFLCLMLPWPHRVEAQVSLPLQSWATSSAVYCLQSIGYDAVQDGHLITIGNTQVEVARACNGLRMLTAFLIIAALVVLLVNRSWWEKLIVLASSLPIALFCNTLRLTVTAIFFTLFKNDYIEKVSHAFGGYAMMPLALALVVGEFWLLRRLFTPQTEVTPAVIERRTRPHAADS
jgi:exosortase